MSKLKNFRIKLSINPYHLFLFLFVYFFGFYAIGSMEPIWGNLDGKIFFWLAQGSLFVSLGLIIFVQHKVSNSRIIEKKFTLILKIEDVYVLSIFIVVIVVLNFRGISYDLEGDETSYAGYTVFHFEKLLRNNVFAFLNNFKESYILQSLLLILFILSVLIAKRLSKLKWKMLLNIAGFLVLFLRILNDTKFKLNTSILPYTDPTLIVNQIGVSFFGFNSTGFRISQLLAYAFFMLVLHQIFTKYYDFNYVKSLFLVIVIVSAPLALSISTKLDLGKFSYFAQTIFVLCLLSPKVIPTRFIASFLVLSVYLRLTNITIIISLLLYFILSKERISKLKRHILEEWTIYIYLLPLFSINIFRIIKDFHLRPLMTGYVHIPYDERLLMILRSFFTSSDLYILLIFVFSLIMFPQKQIVGRNFILIFLGITLVTFTFFTVPTALGHNRFILQIFYPFLTIFLVQLFVSKFLSKKFAYLAASFLLVLNSSLFIIYQERINDFDKFTEIHKWNFNKDFVKQPKYVIWPSTAYGNYMKNYEPELSSNACILVGFYYESMPYVLAGSKHGSLQKVNAIFSSSDYRFFREQSLTFEPGKSLYLPDNIKCIMISNIYYKNELVNYLISNAWRIVSQEKTKNGISIYVLKTFSL